MNYDYEKEDGRWEMRRWGNGGNRLIDDAACFVWEGVVFVVAGQGLRAER